MSAISGAYGQDLEVLQGLRWRYAEMLRFIQGRLEDIDAQLQGNPDDEMILIDECDQMTLAG